MANQNVCVCDHNRKHRSEWPGIGTDWWREWIHVFHQIARVGRKSVSQEGRTRIPSQTGVVELPVVWETGWSGQNEPFVTLSWSISPVMFFKAFKIGSSWWTMSWGVVRKKATMKMNRFATIFFSRTHCLLSERFSQMMSLGGGAYLGQRLQNSSARAIFTRLSTYQFFWKFLIEVGWTWK